MREERPLGGAAEGRLGAAVGRGATPPYKTRHMHTVGVYLTGRGVNTHTPPSLSARELREDRILSYWLDPGVMTISLYGEDKPDSFPLPAWPPRATGAVYLTPAVPVGVRASAGGATAVRGLQPGLPAQEPAAAGGDDRNEPAHPGGEGAVLPAAEGTLRMSTFHVSPTPAPGMHTPLPVRHPRYTCDKSYREGCVRVCR